MKVIVATSNKGKKEEFSRLLKGSPLEPVFPERSLEVEEKGSTYLENALLKARAYCEEFGLPAIADDSGLEVDALDSYPGIYSSRFWKIEYGGVEEDGRSPSERNIRKLLRLLEGKPRTARFRAVVVLCTPHSSLIAEGECRGQIIDQPRGEKGFGYDPIFIPEGLSKTMAQLSPEEKDAISHRGRAVRNLLKLIRDIQPCSYPSP